MAFRKNKENKYKTADSESKFIIFKPKYRMSKRSKKNDRDLPEICRFCVSAHSLFDSDTMLCDIKGVVGCNYSCRKFSYDPLKHIPLQSPSLTGGPEFFPSLDVDDTDDIPVTPISDNDVSKDIHNEKADTESTGSAASEKKDQPIISEEVSDSITL